VPPDNVAVQITFSPIRAEVGLAEHVADTGFPDTTKLKLVVLFNGDPVTTIG
jgi:hypothetical protein